MPEVGSVDYVMRIVLKGIDPNEAARISQMSGQQIAVEQQKILDRLAALHKKAGEARTKEEAKAVNAQIKELGKLAQTYTRLSRDHEIAANKMKHNWRRTLEDLENITVVSSGVIGAFRGIAGSIVGLVAKFADMAEHLDRTAGIYNSLQGSVEAAQAAVGGTVTEIDLIISRNRAMERGLDLNDKQFASLAGRADAYADALGIDMKQALDKMIEGLSTGNVALLRKGGLLISAKEAQKNYAEQIGVTVSQLDDEQKLEAIRSAALQKLSQGMEGATKKAVTLADAMMRLKTGVNDFFSRISASVGNIRLSGDEADLAAARRERAKDIAERHRLNVLEAEEFLEKAASQRAAHESAADRVVSEAFEEMARVQAEIREERREAQSRLEARRAAGLEALRKVGEEILLDIQERIDLMEAVEREFEDRDILGPEILSDADRSLTGERKAERESEAEQQARLRSMIESNLQAFGIEGGLMSAILFGPGGLESLASQTDAASTMVMAMFGQLETAAEQFTVAVGHALFAAIAGNEVSLREQLKAVLDAIGSEAAVRALFEGAKALAFLAAGNPVGAAAAGGAAAGFAATAIAAGVASRAIGPVGGRVSATTSIPPTRRASGPSLGAGTERRGDGGGSSQPPLVVHINGPMLSNVDAVKALDAAFREYEAVYGRRPRSLN